ncbi:unnamed protein product [Amoebophrya sp. A120]|nr:unnamed protein product [Amoebophrya sp. A120]|eukprot:GSA120T00026257001.1
MTQREKEILVVASALGIRGDTLTAISRSQVFLRRQGGVTRSAALMVRKDKTSQLRRMEVLCMCKKSRVNVCPVCSVENWATLFPISKCEFMSACRLAETSGHGPRRTCAITSRLAWNRKKAAKARQKLVAVVSNRQGWSLQARSLSFFEYSDDFARFSDQEQQLLCCWSPEEDDLE